MKLINHCSFRDSAGLVLRRVRHIRRRMRKTWRWRDILLAQLWNLLLCNRCMMHHRRANRIHCHLWRDFTAWHTHGSRQLCCPWCLPARHHCSIISCHWDTYRVQRLAWYDLVRARGPHVTWSWHEICGCHLIAAFWPRAREGHPCGMILPI